MNSRSIVFLVVLGWFLAFGSCQSGSNENKIEYKDDPLQNKHIPTLPSQTITSTTQQSDPNEVTPMESSSVEQGSSTENPEVTHSETKTSEPIGTKPIKLSESVFYKRFTGTLGNSYPIVMHLTRINDQVKGAYYYESQQIPLTLRGTIVNDSTIRLAELDPITHNETGAFDGFFVAADTWRGTWTSADKKRSYPFILTVPNDHTTLPLELIVREKEKAVPMDENTRTLTLSVSYYKVNTERTDPIYQKVEAAQKKRAKEFLLSYWIGDSLPQLDLNVETIDSMMLKIEQAYEHMNESEWGPMLDFTFTMEFSVLYNHDQWLVLEESYYAYSGGAHPNYYTRFYNVDLTTGEEVLLDDVLKPGIKKRLTEEAELYFQKAIRLEEGQSYDDVGFMLDVFYLPDQYYLTPGGIGFLFSTYEIGPYAAGQQEFFVPKDVVLPYVIPTSRYKQLLER